MSTFGGFDKVQYSVASGRKTALCRLYFCRHCLALRRTRCVMHEVDSHYCPNCLENMPSAEAQMKKNRCAGCFDCPSCHHTLSTRATSVAVQESEGQEKAPPKKVYYLACGFCRWTSRDVGMKDQLTASGGWVDLANPDAKRIATLLGYYRQLAQKEKAEREKKRYMRRRNYIHMTDKYGMSSLAARKRTGLISLGGLSLKDDDLKVDDIEPPECFDEESLALPDDIFTAPVNLNKVTNIRQRLADVEFQPEEATSLYPRHKHLLIKRSQRCRECEHNLSKSEFNPSSIKFKIQLVAVHHVPELKIMSANLQPNAFGPAVLTLVNPLDYQTTVKFTPCTEESDWSNAEVQLPQCELLMSARDDAAEFDDPTDQQQNFNDDPNVVVFRKANKIGFVIKVKPTAENEDVKICFNMNYDYKNMAASLQSDSKQPQQVVLTHTLFVNLGKI